MKYSLTVLLVLSLTCLSIGQKNTPKITPAPIPKKATLAVIEHVCSGQDKLIEDGGFERASNGFEGAWTAKDLPTALPKDKNDHIWQCNKDSFMNTYTYLYRSKNNGKLVIDTSRYGLSSAYMFNQIRDEHWDNPYHSVYYKYCKLTKPVKKGQMVKAGFDYVYLPATDQIIFNSGLYFTKDKPKANDIEFVINTPQILNKEQQTAKETWFSVVDSFIAETDLNWVTIGIFSNKSDWVIDRSNMKNYGTGLDKVKPENAKNLGFRVHYDNVFAEVIPIRERLEKFMIYFDMSNAILSDAQIASLKKGMSSIDKSKLASIVLTGYTDDQGSEILNKALSMKRANYIRSILQKDLDLKVDIVATGKGVPESSDSDPIQQRNVTVNLVYK